MNDIWVREVRVPVNISIDCGIHVIQAKRHPVEGRGSTRLAAEYAFRQAFQTYLLNQEANA